MQKLAAIDFKSIKNPYRRCMACGISMLGAGFVCNSCEEQYPGIVKKAIAKVKAEMRVDAIKQQRQFDVQERRSSFRII